MPRTKSGFPLRIPDELNDYMTEKAKKTGIARNALIVQALWEFKKQNEKEER